MRYFAIATDYDGTLATAGRVPGEALEALRRAKASGRKLILVTGRELDDLLRVFPEIGVFDRVVAENGAVLYRPATRETELLCEPPPAGFVEALRAKSLRHLGVGRVIVATVVPHETEVLEEIRRFGLELQLVFNKGAVMILPSGVNKESGLRAALGELGISRHEVVAAGDAENDHALLAHCGLSVAVANALASLRAEADWVTRGTESRGVIELIERLLGDESALAAASAPRKQVLLGWDGAGAEVRFAPQAACVLVAGPSGGGKTTVATAILEAIVRQGFQFCAADPEGDYTSFPGAINVGGPKQKPEQEEVTRLLERFENPVVSLLGIPLLDRPRFFAALLARVEEMRGRVGHPHCVVLDEAHHLVPRERQDALATSPARLEGALLVTAHPDKLSSQALSEVDMLIAVGESPEDTLARFAGALGIEAPVLPLRAEASGEKLRVIAWFLKAGREPFVLRIRPGAVEHDRHRRKYAEGDLEEDAFYFRGPGGKLNLRAQNLVWFNQLADGVDAETWEFHLRRGDYSRWIRKALGDEELARQVAETERAVLSPRESRRRIREAIERAYTAAA